MCEDNRKNYFKSENQEDLPCCLSNLIHLCNLSLPALLWPMWKLSVYRLLMHEMGC